MFTTRLILLFCLLLSAPACNARAQLSIPHDGNHGSLMSGMSAEPVSPGRTISDRPFSRFAAGGDVSSLGVGVGFTTNLNSHLNLRFTGSMFSQPIHFATNGFHTDAQLKLASAGTSLDVYPFHRGLRISPGILFYNQNRLTASDEIAGGSSLTLNDETFYSANGNVATGTHPLNGTAFLNLHATRPAFSITGGWGNPLAGSRHWSFPFEVGVALVGAPQLNVKLAGWACNDQAQTQCADIASPNNALAVRVQSDLQAEVKTWTQNLDPLKTFPIVRGGVTYSFRTARR